MSIDEADTTVFYINNSKTIKLCLKHMSWHSILFI